MGKSCNAWIRSNDTYIWPPLLAYALELIFGGTGGHSINYSYASTSHIKWFQSEDILCYDNFKVSRSYGGTFLNQSKSKETYWKMSKKQ